MDQTVLLAQLEEAFHYRGHVTVFLRDGKPIEGFVYNRVVGAAARSEPPFLELILKGSAERVKILVSDCVAIEKTGEDCASGKSYQDWLDKQAAHKNAS